MIIAGSIFLFLLGILLCFFGSRFYRLWFASAGLFLGIFAGYALGLKFFGQVASGLIAAFVLGLIFAVLFALVVSVGVTLSSACLFGMIVHYILSSFGLGGLWWVILMGAVVGLVLGVIFSHTLILYGSALQGGYLMVLSCLMIYDTYSGNAVSALEAEPMTAIMILVFALSLGLIGAAIQNRRFRTGRQRPINAVMRRDNRAKIYSHRLKNQDTVTILETKPRPNEYIPHRHFNPHN